MSSSSEVANLCNDIERCMITLKQQSDTIIKTMEQCLHTIKKYNPVNSLLTKPHYNSPVFCEQYIKTSSLTYTFKPYPRGDCIYTGIQYVLIRRAALHPTIHNLELVIYGNSTMDMVCDHFKTVNITLPHDTSDTQNQDLISLVQFFRSKYGHSNTYYLVETEAWYKMCCSTLLSPLGQRGMSIMGGGVTGYALYTPPNWYKDCPNDKQLLEEHFNFYNVPYNKIYTCDHQWCDWELDFQVIEADKDTKAVEHFIRNTPDHQNYIIKAPYQYYNMLGAKEVPYLRFLPEEHFNQCPLIIAGFYSNDINSDLGVIIYKPQEENITHKEVCTYVLYYLLFAGYSMDELVTGFTKDKRLDRDERYLTAIPINTGEDYMTYNIRGLNVSTASIISKLSNKSE